MTHEEMDDLYDLYVLGVLEPESAREIDQHVGDQCDYCLLHLHDAVQVAAAMAGLADQVKPPKHLRRRILDAVTPRPSVAKWKFAVGALMAACIVLVALLTWQVGATRLLRGEVAGLTQERDDLRSVVVLLSKPETKAVQFGIADNKPHGRVLINASGGVIFVGTDLPEVTSDKTLELWLIPKNGAPQPAGLFRPTESGNSLNVWKQPVDMAQVQAVAVTIEPRQGSPKPTTQPFLVVPVG